MANFNIELYSSALHRHVSFKMVIPNDIPTDSFPPREKNAAQKRPMKTLFLLHGYTGKGDNWVPDYLATEYNFAIVCPNGENGFWLNGLSTGHAFQTFVGEELVEYVRKTFALALKPEDTYIMGFSMGGFGALHTALAYPETFSKAAAWSSALIVHEVATMKPGQGNPIANYDYYRECFGEPEKVLESENNPETLVKKIIKEQRKMPEIIMAIGTEDFLLEPNRQMHKFLEENHVNHTYWEDSGNHDMQFWHKCCEKFIPVMFGE